MTGRNGKLRREQKHTKDPILIAIAAANDEDRLATRQELLTSGSMLG